MYLTLHQVHAINTCRNRLIRFFDKLIKSNAQRNGYFIKRLHGKIIPCLCTLDLADEVMGEVYKLRQLLGGHLAGFAVFSYVLSDGVVNFRVELKLIHVSNHLTQSYTNMRKNDVRQYITKCLHLLRAFDILVSASKIY